MALDQNTFGCSLSWELSKSNSPFADTSTGVDGLQYSVAEAPSGANQVYAVRLSIEASDDVDVDLHSFTNMLGQSVSITKAYQIFVMPTDDPDNSESDAPELTITEGGTNGLTWFVDGGALVIPSGGLFAYAQPAAQTIDNTHKVINLENTGTGGIVVDLAVIVGT